MKIFSACLLVCIMTLNISPSLIYAQNPEEEDNMRWFADAKLGIFIHWGIYSVNGIDESWSFFNGYISHEDYMKQLDGFTAENYQPKTWAKLIKSSGARYAVITTKHHDGVSLWDTKQSDLNVIAKTPAKRDLVEPFVKALRKEKLKVGLYFSQLDWSYPDYPQKTKTEFRYTEDEARWNKFLDFRFRQIKELSDNFKPDLFWFDGDWEQKAEMWQSASLRDSLKKWQPEVILNSRINGYGDYATPEQGVPIHRPKDAHWELCMTMNDSWGYQPTDTHYKSLDEIIRIFADMISMGGNLLLDIGPKPDGSIDERQVALLEGLGRWTSKHETTIFGTQAGLPPGYFSGPSTLSADSSILYLFLPWQSEGPFQIKGLKNEINRMWVVGSGSRITHRTFGKMYWSSMPGTVFFDIPEEALDENMTVVAVLLKGQLSIVEAD